MDILAMENKLAEMSKAIQQLEEAKLLLKTRLEIRQLDEDIKTIQVNLESLDEKECPWEDQTKVVGEIDAIRNSGKAVWETVGWATHAYHDPFHTGLSKRTPTGEHLLPDVAN